MSVREVWNFLKYQTELAPLCLKKDETVETYSQNKVAFGFLIDEKEAQKFSELLEKIEAALSPLEVKRMFCCPSERFDFPSIVVSFAGATSDAVFDDVHLIKAPSLSELSQSASEKRELWMKLKNAKMKIESHLT